MTDTGNLIATGGLVVATGGLVFYTRQLVSEARMARSESAMSRALGIRPHLAFDAMVLGGRVGMLLIRNVGNGPAIDVDLTLTFKSDRAEETRTWGEPSVVPGESHELRLPDPALSDIGTLSKEPLVVTVSGSMRDLDGLVLNIAERFDLGAWWKRIETAEERVYGRRKLPGVDPMSWGKVQS